MLLQLWETGTLPSAKLSSERGPDHNDDSVLQPVERSPTTSLQRITRQLNICKSSVRCTLHFHGFYEFHKHKHLQPGDNAARLLFCEWINANHCILSQILFTDEAAFTLNDINNTRNSHCCSQENPYATVDDNFQYRFSVNVWCGMIDNQ